MLIRLISKIYAKNKIQKFHYPEFSLRSFFSPGFFSQIIIFSQIILLSPENYLFPENYFFPKVIFSRNFFFTKIIFVFNLWIKFGDNWKIQNTIFSQTMVFLENVFPQKWFSRNIFFTKMVIGMGCLRCSNCKAIIKGWWATCLLFTRFRVDNSNTYSELTSPH